MTLSKTKPKGIQKKISFKEFFKRNNRKKLALFTIVVLAAIGAYILFFASAATNNCQTENGVKICDVDQVGSSNDSVLSLDGEAEKLGKQGWGVYYGTAFRAPTSTYDGAVPVYRVFNPAASWHDYVTTTQKSQKEALAGGAGNLKNEGVPFFAWTDGRHPGTVPVYRITRGGAESQAMFSTDKAWVDKMVAGPWGWKSGESMPSIAFYAFPPGYAVTGQANPYDCSILENYVSERCTEVAGRLEREIASGNMPTSNECPKTWADWNKDPYPAKFDQVCQDMWNKYAKDCSNTDVFFSDNCKAEREALAEANRKAAEAKKKADAENRKRNSGSGPKNTSTPGNGSSNQDNNDPCGIKQGTSINNCTPTTQSPTVNDRCGLGQGSSLNNCSNPADIPRGTCLVKWSMSKFLKMGSSTASYTYSNVTRSQCLSYLEQRSKQTNWNDFFARKRYNFNAYWPNSSTHIGYRAGIMK